MAQEETKWSWITYSGWIGPASLLSRTNNAGERYCGLGRKDGRTMGGMWRRVVVTGVGLVSPTGIGTDAAWNAILASRSGIAMPLDVSS